MEGEGGKREEADCRGGQALAENRSTVRLDLEGCGVGDVGCSLVRELLKRNKRISEIDLQLNQVGTPRGRERKGAWGRSDGACR